MQCVQLRFGGYVMHNSDNIQNLCYQQDRQLVKKSNILEINFSEVTTQKNLVTCMTQTDNIVMTRTIKVATHDPSDNQ